MKKILYSFVVLCSLSGFAQDPARPNPFTPPAGPAAPAAPKDVPPPPPQPAPATPVGQPTPPDAPVQPAPGGGTQAPLPAPVQGPVNPAAPVVVPRPAPSTPSTGTVSVPTTRTGPTSPSTVSTVPAIPALPPTTTTTTPSTVATAVEPAVIDATFSAGAVDAPAIYQMMVDNNYVDNYFVTRNNQFVLDQQGKKVTAKLGHLVAAAEVAACLHTNPKIAAMPDDERISAKYKALHFMLLELNNLSYRGIIYDAFHNGGAFKHANLTMLAARLVCNQGKRDESDVVREFYSALIKVMFAQHKTDNGTVPYKEEFYNYYAAAIAADNLLTNRVEFDQIYTLMIRQEKFANQTGYTRSAAFLTDCLDGTPAEKVARLTTMLKAMGDSRIPLVQRRLRVFDQQRNAYVLVGERNDSDLGMVASRLVCLQGNRTAAQMVNRLDDGYLGSAATKDSSVIAVYGDSMDNLLATAILLN